MEQIIQLKTMRDAALARLQVNPDFKLVNSLDALIQDLEAVAITVDDAVVMPEVVSEPELVADALPVEPEVLVVDEPIDALVTDSIDQPLEVPSFEVSRDFSASTAPVVEDLEVSAPFIEPKAELEDDAAPVFNQEVAEAAIERPDDAASAIEALEAELSAGDGPVEHNDTAQPGSMIS